ncbi:SipW-dependent-type signal peptide-containing protein [Enterococcus camelliae]|uniref:SipW-dependent-type signal peptide-containing protein n=1 Tax=Enterococcus camelliae TaxID=453959 RepID=A0ABW5TLD1_9ENTE
MFNKSEQKSQKDTNRKNRKYSILLLALLFIGVATYGTYAYFTDSKSVDGQLALTKGQVSLGEEHSDWTYKGNTGSGDDYASLKTDNKPLSLKNDNISAQTGSSFSDVLPGDTFKTTITVSYTGSVDATGTIALNTNGISKAIDYVVLFNNGGENEQLSSATETINFSANDESTKKLTFTLIVHVPYNSLAENFAAEGRNNGSTNTFLDSLTDAITVNVQQKLASNN